MRIEIIFNKSFKKKLEKYVSKHPVMEMKIKDKLEQFSDDPFAPELKNHKLSGKLDGLRVISIDHDCRIMFELVSENRALLVNIGKHDKVY